VATGEEIVSEARALLGVPYVYGAEGPTADDCSGLVQYVFTKAGLNVPRVSSAQFSFGQQIDASQLAPGDLVFSEWSGDDVPHHGHVAIYSGNGMIIEAPHPGAVVHEVPLDASYLSHVDGYTRPVGLSTGPASPVTGGARAGGGTGATANAAGFDWNPLSWPGNLLNWMSGGITGDASQLISGAVSTLADIVKFAALFFQPSTYIRIGAGILGFIFLIAGLVMLSVEAFQTS
jgi:NlpC/P60 family protein